MTIMLKKCTLEDARKKLVMTHLMRPLSIKIHRKIWRAIWIRLLT